MQYPIGYKLVKKNVVFGDMLSATPKTLFTVDGVIELITFGHIKTTVLSGGALTLEVGIPGNTAALIAQAAKADLLINTIWGSATPANPFALPSSKIICNGADVKLVTGVANATAGVIDFYALWRKISTDGNLVAA